MSWKIDLYNFVASRVELREETWEEWNGKQRERYTADCGCEFNFTDGTLTSEFACDEHLTAWKASLPEEPELPKFDPEEEDCLPGVQEALEALKTQTTWL